MKDLEKVPAQEQQEFIKSFDHVLCDMDGVIWLKFKPLPGASEALDALRKLGKQVKFVTNNDFTTATDILKYLEAASFASFDKDDLMLPVLAIIEYLRNIKFDKELYLVSTASVRTEFEKAGFKLASFPHQEVMKDMEDLVARIRDNENIGCVINLTDVNLTFMKLQRCLTYLKRKDCLWIVGPTDSYFPVGPVGPVYGPGFFVKGVKEISGRDYLQLAKPSQDFNNFFVQKFNIPDPKRVLFIGDTINQDMRMATIGGYKKLLVLTGVTKIEDIHNWTFEEELKPDYYIECLDSLHRILENIAINNKY